MGGLCLEKELALVRSVTNGLQGSVSKWVSLPIMSRKKVPVPKIYLTQGLSTVRILYRISAELVS